MRVRRWVIALAAAPLCYLVLLGVLGFALRGCVTEQVRERLALALDAEVTIGDSSLSLLRGELELEGVRVVREHGGHVQMEVAHIAVDLAPLGWAAIDHGVRHADVRGGRMEISARGLYEMAERRRKLMPVPIEELVLRDCSIVVMPTRLLPRLGRIELAITSAHTTDVSLRHGLSWLFRMSDLEADVTAMGATFGVSYSKERLGVRGGLFGSDPMSFHFPLPQPGPDGYELKTVLVFVKELSKAIASQLGDEVKDTVLDWIGDLF